jgi:DNA-binding transcriptional LysR family regulator
MHLENFKIFTDLVESESFSRAAKTNGITQSAVSQQMRAMEKHFNVLIVDRGQKQFRLTREGRKIYEVALEFLRLYDQLSGELQEMRKVVSGPIHLSTIYSIGLHELPAYIKLFLKEYPAVNVRVEYRRSNLVYEDVLHNAVDLGLVAFPIKARQIEVIPFQEDQLVVICSPGHPLAARKEVTVEELSGHKFIGFDQDIPTRKATDSLFKEYKIDIEPVMEFDNIETVKRAVEVDAGIAIVPETTILQEIKQRLLCRLQLKGRRLVRPLAIIHRKGRVLSPAIKKFIQMLTTRDLVKVLDSAD